MPTISSIFDDITFAIDTAGSWDGSFPNPTSDCYLVGIETAESYELILVSSRYVGATDEGDAATIAVDAWHERYGHEVPWPAAFGGPFYHVDVWSAVAPDDRDKVKGIVRSDPDTGDWDWEPASDND